MAYTRVGGYYREDDTRNFMPRSYEVSALLQAGAFEVINKQKALEDLYGAVQTAVGILS